MKTPNRYFHFAVAVERNYCKLQGQFWNVWMNQTMEPLSALLLGIDIDMMSAWLF
jgi:hypothetical protein